MRRLSTHDRLIPFFPLLLSRNPGTEEPVYSPVSCDLPSPEEVAHNTDDVEVREPGALDFEPRDSVEEKQCGSLIRGRLFIFVACGNGLGGFAVGEEARLEAWNELDKENLLGRSARGKGDNTNVGRNLLRQLQSGKCSG